MDVLLLRLHGGPARGASCLCMVLGFSVGYHIYLKRLISICTLSLSSSFLFALWARYLDFQSLHFPEVTDHTHLDLEEYGMKHSLSGKCYINHSFTTDGVMLRNRSGKGKLIQMT